MGSVRIEVGPNRVVILTGLGRRVSSGDDFIGEVVQEPLQAVDRRRQDGIVAQDDDGRRQDHGEQQRDDDQGVHRLLVARKLAPVLAHPGPDPLTVDLTVTLSAVPVRTQVPAHGRGDRPQPGTESALKDPSWCCPSADQVASNARGLAEPSLARYL